MDGAPFPILAQQALYDRLDVLTPAFEGPCMHEALFDDAPDGYLVTDHLGIIQEANRVAAAFLAMPQASLVGIPFARFIPPEAQQVFRRGWEALQPGERYFWSVRARFTIDGRPMATRWAHANAINCNWNDLADGRYHRFVTPPPIGPSRESVAVSRVGLLASRAHGAASDGR